LGAYWRHIEASFNYIVPSEGQIQNGVEDFSHANHRMNSRKIGFVYGGGIQMAEKDGWCVGIEYNCKRQGSLHDQRVIMNIMGGGVLDKNGMPRYYSVKKKNFHSFAIWISKSI